MKTSLTSAPTRRFRCIFWSPIFFFCWFKTPDRFNRNLMYKVMRNLPCEMRMSFEGEWVHPMAVDNLRTRSVTLSLTLLSRLVVRPMAFESLESSDDEWRLAGKLNFLFEGDRTAFSSVLLSASSDDNITSGVNIVRVGFVIASCNNRRFISAVIKIDWAVKTVTEALKQFISVLCVKRELIDWLADQKSPEINFHLLRLRLFNWNSMHFTISCVVA